MIVLALLAAVFALYNLKLSTSFRLTPMLFKDYRHVLLMVNNLKFDVEGGNICYDFSKASSHIHASPLVVYLPGLVREKSESKSVNFHSFCKRNEVSFLAADYFGVGGSSGSFSEGYITRWTTDSIQLIDHLLLQEVKDASGAKVVLVGHGVGAWIAFLIALKRPDLVAGILGISADADFTEELLWKILPESIKEAILRDGVCEVQWGNEKYPITKNLIEDGRKNLLLSQAPGTESF